ncbi:MAG: choice-of-anchor D domain-containing protein [Verrucomicrobia bacterium]|nr:choice-of-anchor D domain-containing protein [Verrucomicrobiota bacterium]
MKNKFALLTALFGILLAVPAHSGVVGVDVNGTATSAGVLDPSSRTWKAVGTSFALDSMTVGTSVSGGTYGSYGSPGIPIFANYLYSVGGTITVTLTGLDDSQTYNLAVMMSQAFGPRGGAATVTTAGATNPPAESTDPANLSTFAEGNNYVLFEGLTTGTTPGQITFTVANGPDGIGILNGFEIQNIDPTAPGIRVPDSVTGSCHGEPTSLSVTINNTAGIAYHVTGTSYSGVSAAQFSDTTTTPLEIPAGGSSNVFVDFTPTTGGTANATLTLTTDDPSVPSVDVPLSVAVHDPEVSVATSLAFGSFIVPPGPTPSTISVNNLGLTSALTLSNPQITGTGAAAFSVTSLPASIDADSNDQVEVTFNPAGPGVYQAQLSLDTNDTFNPTVTINLSGMVYGGGTPKMQWGFDFTTGTVQSNGATVTDDTGSGNSGKLLAPGSGTGGTYTSDIPTAGTAVGQAKNVTGVGSLDVTGPGGVCTGTGAYSGESLNGLSAAAVDAAGGLTYEIWVKNASSTLRGNLIGLGATHGIGVRPNVGIGFYYGDNNEFLAPATPIDTTEWTHVAAVMAVKPGTGAKQFSKITLYVNGRRVAEDADGRTFPWFLERGAAIGIHPVLGVGVDDAEGLLYEPRISAGTLTPAEFTVVTPPAGIFATDEVAGSTDDSTVSLTIEVENTAGSGRTLTEPTFSGPGAAFFTVANFPATLTPGERSSILVDFDANASGPGIFTATMTIHSDDPNRPAYEVTLTVEVIGAYSSWADQWVEGQAANLDFDNDGVANGVEYFMGNTTPGFTANPPISSDRMISWPKGADYSGAYGADYRLETSADLETWTQVPQTNVSIDADSIDYTLPLDGTRNFVRLVVTGP